MKKNNLAKNTLLLSLCTFINKGLMFAMVPLFSRWLSTEDYGTFDVFTTYVALLIPIITLSCSDAIFRLSLDKKSEEGKSYYITNGLLIVVLNTIFAVIILCGLKLFINFNNFEAFLILLIGEVFDNYIQGYLRAIKRLDIYAYTKTIGVILISVLVTIFVYIMKLGLSGIILGYAFGYIISNFFALIVTKYPRFFKKNKISLGGAKELVSYSYPLIPNSISWWVINVSDRFIINVFLGALSNGIYAIACKIPNICSAIFGVFNISWQETATEIISDSDRNEYYNIVFNKMIGILISLCSGIICCNFIFFGFIFDNKYYIGHLYSPILVSAIIFSTLSQFFGGIQISLKKPKDNGISTVIGAICNLVIHLIMIKYIGLYAACVSTLISNIIVTIIRKKKLGDDIDIKLTNKTYIYIVFYIYFIICVYISKNIMFNMLNLLLSGLLFIYINKEFVIKIKNRVFNR